MDDVFHVTILTSVTMQPVTISLVLDVRVYDYYECRNIDIWMESDRKDSCPVSIVILERSEWSIQQIPLRRAIVRC